MEGECVSSMRFRIFSICFGVEIVCSHLQLESILIHFITRTLLEASTDLGLAVT